MIVIVTVCYGSIQQDPKQTNLTLIQPAIHRQYNIFDLPSTMSTQTVM